MTIMALHVVGATCEVRTPGADSPFRTVPHEHSDPGYCIRMAAKPRDSLKRVFSWACRQGALANTRSRGYPEQRPLLKDQQQRAELDTGIRTGMGECDRACAPIPMNVSVKRTWALLGRCINLAGDMMLYVSPGVAMGK